MPLTINRRHGLYPGLVGAWTGRDFTRELRSNTRGTISPGGFTTTAYGPAAITLHSTPIYFSRSEFNILGDFSLFFAGKFPNAGVISPMIYITDGTSIKLYMWLNGGTTLFMGYRDTGGTFRDYTGTVTNPGNNGSFTAAASCAVSGGAWFTQFNGANAGSGTTTGSPATLTTPVFRPGSGPDSGLPGTTHPSVAYVWNRAVPADQLRKLHRDPHALILRPRRRVEFTGTSPPPSTYIGARFQMIGSGIQQFSGGRAA